MNNNENNINQNVTPNVGTAQPTTNVQPVAPQPVSNIQPSNVTPTIETVQPTVDVQNVSQQNTTSNETVQSSVVEEISSNTEDMSDVADITFDYNQIYGEQNNNQDTEENLDVVEKPMFTAQELEIKVNDLQNRTTNDIVPEFNINALNENVSKEDSKLTDTVLNDKQQDKQNTRRAIIWIVVLVLILVIFVGFIFPIINGYKF